MSDVNRERDWFPLDNAAKIFPPITGRRKTTVFRISATLKKPVVYESIREALRLTLHRFPYFQVRIRRGFFWYYFDRISHLPPLERDPEYPCMWDPTRSPGIPLRIRISHGRIALEVAHALTDGMGALEFLKTLMASYLSIEEGLSIPSSPHLLSPFSTPHPEETEDSFARHYQPGIPSSSIPPRAFHVLGSLIPPGRYYITTGLVPSDGLRGLARSYHTTVTALLTALYFLSFHTIIREGKAKGSKPIIIQIPVNLRRLFPSQTMRNFFLLMFPRIDPRLGEYEFEEILSYVTHFMKMESTPKALAPQIRRNVGGERNPFARFVPVFLKDLVLSRMYEIMGDRRATSSLSNLGVVQVPEEMRPYIERFDFYPPPNPIMKICAGVITFGDTVSLSFGRLIHEPVVERVFFRWLTEKGLPVTIETNVQEDYHL
ncbi:hypothetical protein [Spirochaeta thermophila]|uniref:Alcohol acetyltransferase n=1 Tax=Winmispira thermophila (strain ATCC 49972 / DSM 6192 / RI 19.B1) TaxID=665571 RepID=E0RSZ2_WINT6|nr:hypothetical protein [Spirochaeta thermophila]ADN02129.1 hypothetical protein STHERM_c11880 [Spirochaeta thermophila DSM 6192]